MMKKLTQKEMLKKHFEHTDNISNIVLNQSNQIYLMSR